MKSVLLFILPLFILISCQVEESFLTTEDESETLIFEIDEERELRGSVSENIIGIELYIGDEKIDTALINDGEFSVRARFRDEMNSGVLRFEGSDSKGPVLEVLKTFAVKGDEAFLDDERFVFDFKAPTKEQMKTPLTLWATNYYLPIVESIEVGFDLRDLNGNSLGPKLSRRDWCSSALEGSVLVKGNGGSVTTYNYAGRTSDFEVDCSIFYDNTPSHKVKFRVANGEYGDGVGDYKLVPFRSIAVDPTFYPYGSVIYIPQAKGHIIELPSGERVAHDGYFFASDTGGLIKETHIDVYTGTARSDFPFVKSRPDGTFKAYIIENETVKSKLESIHTK